MGLRGNPRTAWGEIPVARPARAPGSRSGQRPTQPLRGKVTMTDEKNSGPQEGVKGVVEDVKGKAKEAVGTVTGRDDMVREGKAQQDKADAQPDGGFRRSSQHSQFERLRRSCRFRRTVFGLGWAFPYR